MTMTLCPAQQAAYDQLTTALPVGNVFALTSSVGRGKTTVLRAIAREQNAAFLTMKEFVDALRNTHPLAMEETFESLLRNTLKSHEFVILDDLHLLYDVVCGCGFTTYPRAKFLHAPLTMLAAYAIEADKKLLFGGSAPDPIGVRGYQAHIEKFSMQDYAALCSAYLDAEDAAQLDYAKVFRFAPKLNAHQIKAACLWLRANGQLDTDSFIEYLRSQRMGSNVDLGEVQAVDLHELKGVDDVLQSLEANIILPLENDVLASELDIRPKRGVLLAGPPGTGKTTIGRALAHRLRSKFFLIDGTFISGTRDFYQKISQVFEAAKDNAPSIIFIDDSDVIFENKEEMGLYRYLLTMLDGLESESAGRVCVMMTAMDVGNLPPALIRSGRVELWLETRLPDETARTAILQARCANLPAAFRDIAIDRLAEATEGLTGADIKRVIEDGKILYAYDRSQGLPLRSTTEYFLAAVETIRVNKDRYAAAETLARQRHPSRPSWFDMAGAMGIAGFRAAEDDD